MAEQAVLDAIARGDATPVEASAALVPILERGDAELLADAYVALRAWVWKALDGRRRGEELRGWHAVISATATVMGHRGQPGLSERLRALAELLQESIAMGEGLVGVDLRRHVHVAALLEALQRLGGEAARADIAAEAALKSEVLSRTLNLAISAGLVERVPRETARFRLSRAGVEACG
jgi:hypothetical protein